MQTYKHKLVFLLSLTKCQGSHFTRHLSTPKSFFSLDPLLLIMLTHPSFHRQMYYSSTFVCCFFLIIFHYSIWLHLCNLAYFYQSLHKNCVTNSEIFLASKPMQTSVLIFLNFWATSLSTE